MIIENPRMVAVSVENLSNPRPIYRKDDNELLGYVKQNGEKWLALTFFGYAFDEAQSEHDAEQIVKNKGLAVLTDTWQYFDTVSSDWLRCVIIEASKDHVRVARMDGFYPDTSKTYVVSSPVAEYLRR